MSDAGEYNSSQIRKTVWGNFSEREDGTWETIWKLTLTTPSTQGIQEIYQDRFAGFDARLVSSGGYGAELRITTREWAMSAEHYPLTFKSFRIVNDSYSEISTIQGLPRDWYAPFRSRGSSQKNTRDTVE